MQFLHNNRTKFDTLQFDIPNKISINLYFSSKPLFMGINHPYQHFQHNNNEKNIATIGFTLIKYYSPISWKISTAQESIRQTNSTTLNHITRTRSHWKFFFSKIIRIFGHDTTLNHNLVRYPGTQAYEFSLHIYLIPTSGLV